MNITPPGQVLCISKYPTKCLAQCPSPSKPSKIAVFYIGRHTREKEREGRKNEDKNEGRKRKLTKGHISIFKTSLYFNGVILFWQNINLVFLMVVLTIHSGPKYLPAKAGECICVGSHMQTQHFCKDFFHSSGLKLLSPHHTSLRHF